MWFYELRGQRMGPVDDAEMGRLIVRGVVAGKSLVWKKGLPDWTSADRTELKDLIATHPSPPPLPNLASSSSGKTSSESGSVGLATWYISYGICLGLSVLLFTGYALSYVFYLMGALFSLAATVFFCLILHRLWSLIPPENARTTPGKAVGFCFIPLFNFYWMFIAYWGLAKALNAELRRLSISSLDVKEDLALVYCILLCASVIPFVNFFTGLSGIFVVLLSLNQFKNAGIAILAMHSD